MNIKGIEFSEKQVFEIACVFGKKGKSIVDLVRVNEIGNITHAQHICTADVCSCVGIWWEGQEDADYVQQISPHEFKKAAYEQGVYISKKKIVARRALESNGSIPPRKRATNLGIALGKKAKERGITQKSISDATGYPTKTISRVCRGEFPAMSETLFAIAAVIGMGIGIVELETNNCLETGAND